MFQELRLFQLAHGMAVHAGKRQALTAKNMANADTPGYRAVDVPDFQDLVKSRSGGFVQRASNSLHMHGAMGLGAMNTSRAGGGEADPNGNTVSLEQEMLRGVAAKRQHDKALAIYKSSLTILRKSLGR